MQHENDKTQTFNEDSPREECDAVFVAVLLEALDLVQVLGRAGKCRRAVRTDQPCQFSISYHT